MNYLPDRKALELYDEMLDECHEAMKIGCLTFSPSRVLKELDPTAYDTGFADWCDSENITTDENEDEDEEEEVEE